MGQLLKTPPSPKIPWERKESYPKSSSLYTICSVPPSTPHPQQPIKNQGHKYCIPLVTDLCCIPSQSHNLHGICILCSRNSIRWHQHGTGDKRTCGGRMRPIETRCSCYIMEQLPECPWPGQLPIQQREKFTQVLRWGLQTPRKGSCPSLSHTFSLIFEKCSEKCQGNFLQLPFTLLSLMITKGSNRVEKCLILDIGNNIPNSCQLHSAAFS